MSDEAAHTMRIAKATHGGDWVQFFDWAAPKLLALANEEKFGIKPAGSKAAAPSP